jgi:TonB-dependent starch-binding outer membrane protein SusC
MIKNTQGENFKISELIHKRLFMWLLAVLMMIGSLQLSAASDLQGNAQQKIKVKGQVISSSDNTGLPGVSVLEKGTSNGTLTDIDGKFSLDVKSAETVLLFSFVGYEPQEVVVGEQTEINIVLKEKTQSLDEIVVVGYGVQKKKLVTGATLQVKGDDITKLSASNAIQAIQGQTAGVNITSTSGQPGEGMKVVIRGIGTNGNSSPLYIVDGVQVGDISYINNSDIESIDVLKDAASAAIYGSRGANGVILVTTKRGKSGKAVITLDGYTGYQNLGRKISMLNSKEYATMMNEQSVNSGGLPYFTQDSIAKMGDGTDWLDEMFVSNAKVQNYSLGITGGNATSNFSTSLSYNSQEGIVGGKKLSNYEKFGFRINSEHKLIKEILKVGQHLTFSYSNKNGIQVGGNYSNSLRGAFSVDPFLKMYDAKGDFYNNSATTNWNNAVANPYASMVLNNQNENNSQKLLGDIYFDLQPIKNLTLRTTLGMDFNSGEYHSYTPIYELSLYSFNKKSKTNQSMYKNYALTWTNTANYGLNLGDNRIDAMLGYEARKYIGTSINGSNVDLTYDGLKYSYLGNTTNKKNPELQAGGSKSDDMMISYFGRIGYNFKETYIFSATVRADGSSKFAPGHQWGYFPSVSAGWTVTNESFMKNFADVVNVLKVRASWGQNGNNAISSHAYEATILSTYCNYIFGNEEGSLTPGSYPERLGNESLKWETAEQTNIGFDAGFLKERLNITFDLYKKTTKDWLIIAPIYATAGANAPYKNGGDVENKGFELVATWKDKIGDLNYSISANISKNINEVTSIPTKEGVIRGGSNELWNNAPDYYCAQSGFPIAYFWGYKTAGVFQNEAEVLAYKNSSGQLILPNAKPGDLKYVDVSGDGKWSMEDKTMIGDPNPDYTFGFNVSANYKGFDFSLTANGVAGNQLVQSYRNHDQKANYSKTILDRWHGEGSSNKIPRVTLDAKNFIEFSDLYVQDGDFLRISNITLGYDLSKLIKVNAISQMRIFVTAQNLLTLTKYDGMDPEVGYGSGFSYGVDLGFYPRPRTILCGFNIKF